MRNLSGSAAAVVAGLTLTGCNEGSGSSATAVGYVSPVAAQPGQQQITQGLEQVGKSKNWKVIVLDANLSSDRQVSDVDSLITQGVKALGAWSLDPNAVAAAYSRAQAQAIPVVGLNSVGTGITRTVWWEIDTCHPGGPFDRMAKWITDRKPGAKVVAFGGPPVEAIENNVKCFMAAAKAAGLDIVDRADNLKDSSSNAATLAADEITKHPEATVFFAYNDSTALGISAALGSANRPLYGDAHKDGTMVFGINGDSEAIAAVKEGRLTGTWDPNTLATGIAIGRAMSDSMADPKAAPKPLVVRSDFYTADTIASWVDPTKRDFTLDNIPLVAEPAATS